MNLLGMQFSKSCCASVVVEKTNNAVIAINNLFIKDFAVTVPVMGTSSDSNYYVIIVS